MFSGSEEKAQVDVSRPVPLPAAVAPGAAVPGVVGGGVGVAGSAVTLMISHKRESSLTCMIRPAGFLMTKLPRRVPVAVGATRSMDMSAVWPG